MAGASSCARILCALSLGPVTAGFEASCRARPVRCTSRLRNRVGTLNPGTLAISPINDHSSPVVVELVAQPRFERHQRGLHHRPEYIVRRLPLAESVPDAHEHRLPASRVHDQTSLARSTPSCSARSTRLSSSTRTCPFDRTHIPARRCSLSLHPPTQGCPAGMSHSGGHRLLKAEDSDHRFNHAYPVSCQEWRPWSGFGPADWRYKCHLAINRISPGSIKGGNACNENTPANVEAVDFWRHSYIPSASEYCSLRATIQAAGKTAPRQVEARPPAAPRPCPRRRKRVARRRPQRLKLAPRPARAAPPSAVG